MVSTKIIVVSGVIAASIFFDSVGSTKVTVIPRPSNVERKLLVLANKKELAIILSPARSKESIVAAMAAMPVEKARVAIPSSILVILFCNALIVGFSCRLYAYPFFVP